MAARKVPRLVFGGSKAAVRFRKRNSSAASITVEEEDENSRSSIDSTAGRGSYIHNQSDFTFKVSLAGLVHN